MFQPPKILAHALLALQPILGGVRTDNELRSPSPEPLTSAAVAPQSGALGFGSPEEEVGVGSAICSKKIYQAVEGGQILARGHSGPAVRSLQEILNACGARPPLELTGEFEVATEKALANLKLSNGLKGYSPGYVDEEILLDLGTTITQDLGAMLRLLGSADSELRRFAAYATGYRDEPELIEHGTITPDYHCIVDSLHDAFLVETDREARIEMALALAAYLDARAVGPLLEQLSQRDSKIIPLIIDALSNFPSQQVVSALIGVLNGSSYTAGLDNMTRNACWALTLMGDLSQPELERVYRREKSAPSDLVAIVLAGLGSKAVLEHVLEVAGDQNSAFRGEAIRALCGHADDSRVAEALTAALADEHMSTRVAALVSLATRGPEDSGYLRVVMNSCLSSPYSYEITEALFEYGEMLCPALIDLLSDPEVGDICRTVTLRMLRIFGTKPAVIEALISKISNADTAPQLCDQARSILASGVMAGLSEQTLERVISALAGTQYLPEFLAKYGTTTAEVQTLEQVLKKLHESSSPAAELGCSVALFERAGALGIEFALRFSPDLTEQLLRNRESPVADERPLAIVVYPRSDHNGAFRSESILRDLIDQGYRVMYYESSTDSEVISSLKDGSSALDSDGVAQRASLIVLGAHGEQSGMQYGPERGEDSSVDLTDGPEFSAAEVANVLLPGGQVLLDSCSTGRGGRAAGNMVKFFRLVFPQAGAIYGPVAPAYVKQMRFNERGLAGVDFEVDGYRSVRTFRY